MNYKVTKAHIQSLCPVPPDFYAEIDNGEARVDVMALALVEVTLESDEGPITGQELVPVIAGYNDESDSLRLLFPSRDDLEPTVDTSNLSYAVGAFGDLVAPVVVGRYHWQERE